MNFAELNHILIPKTAEQQQRWRKSWLMRWSLPVRWYYGALSREGRVLVVLTMVIGAASVNVGRTDIYLLWSTLIGLLIGTLLLRPAFGMKGVELDAVVPPRVALGKPLKIELRVKNTSERTYGTVRARRPFLPWDGEWIGSEPAVSELGPGTRRLEVRAKFISRGEHRLGSFEVGELLPLGLSLGPVQKSPRCRFLVVPRIAPVRSLSVPEASRYQPGGVAQASRMGEAMELVGVRPYRPGDRVRDLHVRTWARTGQPHVREYQQEYFSRIGVILDTDASVSERRRFEAAISLTAGVMAKLSRGEALIDLLVVGDTLHPFTMGRSLGFLEQALDVLATVAPGPKLEPSALLEKLTPHLARLSSVIVISESPDESRRQLVREIERAGIPCRVLWVGADASDAERTEQSLSVEDIEGDVGLSL